MSTPTASPRSKALTSTDGLRLPRYLWLPDSAPQAVVVLVHGYAEHAQRYQHVAEHLRDQGWAVHAYDQRGHGHAEGPRAYVSRFEQYLDDLESLLAVVRAEHPDLPLFLLGHSMGGLVVAAYCLDRKPSLNGVILSAAALKVSEDLSPMLQRMAGIMSVLAPRLKTVKLSSVHISKDPEVVATYDADPLVYRKGTKARMGAEMLAATKRVAGRLHEWTLPVLILHGGADKLTDPVGSQQLYEQAATEEKEFIRYKGFFHEIMNEPEKDQVLSDISNWINSRLA